MNNDKVQSIMALVDRYWSLAYDEGKEGRNHDTPDGAAQATLLAIQAAIREAIAAPGVAQGPLTEQEIEGLEVWKQFVGLWPDKRLEIVRTVEAAHGIVAAQPTAEQPTPPASSPYESARSLAKWLNERPNRPIDLRDVAMLVHHVQSQPIKGGPAE